MKQHIRKVILISLLILSPFSRVFAETENHPSDHKKEEHEVAEDHELKNHDPKGEEVSGNVGPGKAIEEVHEETGIRLSAKALKRLGIKTIPISPNISAYPPLALVKYQEETKIYRQRQGWFKLVTMNPNSFQAGDEIVVSGAALLRIAELDAFGSGEEGHGH